MTTDTGGEPTAETQPWLVVIGASAGGIEALSTIVATLPASFPAPIVIAQHLDPRRTSRLEEILARRTPLRVQEVQDRHRLEPGVIYVVPAGHHIEIADGHVASRVVDGGRPQPSVDILFESAARAYGDHVIAVVLTGSGHDGADGARVVKEAGGTVVIQNPETAAFPNMPLSLPPTLIDVVADLDAIGPLILDLLSGAYIMIQPDEDRQLRSFLEQLRDRSGIDFRNYKTPTILRRLRHRMASTRTENLAAYMRYLQRNPSEYQRLVNSFLIKVTEFFRDPELFSYLRESVLPELVSTARHHGNELRLWSAGCATGEEAYSLAILVAEYLESENESLNVRIFATDVDTEAIDFARRGIYSASTLATLPEDLAEKYFTKIDSAYEVKKTVRSMVVFGQHDLGQRAPFPRIDLALCRNVLIYFTNDLQKRALQLFAFSLRDRGYLVLGKAETAGPLAEAFALEHPRLKVFRRAGDRVLIPPARIRDTVPAMPARLSQVRRAPTGLDVALARLHSDVQRPRTTGERADGVLLRLPVGLVCVNRRYDIQLINNAARRLLGIHTTAIGEDVIHLARNLPSRPFRTTIDAAFAGNEQADVFEVSSAEFATNGPQYLEIRCYPERGDSEQAEIETVSITITDLTSQVTERRAVEQEQARLREEAGRQAAQVQRLVESNRQLIAANQELTATNAELRSANEELLVANEEVQAATEEVETLNEELQATNEELETLNEELQATVEELTTTNDDLQARTLEMQEMTSTLERQRRESELQQQRLFAVLDSIGEAVALVDEQGRVSASNNVYNRLFGGAQPPTFESESGARLTHEQMPRLRAARGESFQQVLAAIEPDGSRRWYEAIGLPALGDEGDCGVIMIRPLNRDPAT